MPTFDTPEPILAIIDLATANVRINASDRADTVVEIRPSDEFSDADVQAAEHTQVEYADGRLLVRADKDRAAPPSGWGFSLDKLVESPAARRGWLGRRDGRPSGGLPHRRQDGGEPPLPGRARRGELHHLLRRHPGRAGPPAAAEDSTHGDISVTRVDRACRDHHDQRRHPHRRDRRHGGGQDLPRRDPPARGDRRTAAELRPRRHHRRSRPGRTSPPRPRTAASGSARWCPARSSWIPPAAGWSSESGRAPPRGWT